MVTKWRFVSGQELLAASRAGPKGIEGLVTSGQGIYIWQRSFVPPEDALDMPAVFEEWLKGLLTVPLATTENARINHYAWVERLNLGGGGIAAEKGRDIEVFSRSPAARRLVVRLLDEISAYSPALYVGEASNLATRVWQHLQDQTDFAERLKVAWGLDWADVNLRFTSLPEPRGKEDEDKAKRLRTMIEYAVTRLTLGVGVSRSG